jgi:hypothetical protein
VAGHWFAYLLWGTVLLAFVVMWVSYGAGLVRSVRAVLHPRAVAAFARANGWSYQDRGWRPLRPGPPYWSVGSAVSTHLVSGTSQGEVFVAYEYAHQAQVVSLKLPMSLPFVEVRPHGLAGGTSVTLPNVTLESEAFGRRFWVHADDPKFASVILHPRLMHGLLQASPLCWRIWKDDLVGWWPGEPAPAQILNSLAVLHTIKDSIPAFVWHDYGLTDTSTS